LRCPPDRLPAKSSGLGVELEAASRSRARSSISRCWPVQIAGIEGAEEVLALLTGGAQAHVVHDRELGQRLGELEGPDHAAPGDLVRRDAAEVLALERPGALVGLVEAGEQVEEGRLAGTVRTDQRGDDAALHLEVVDLDRGEAAEAAGHPVGDQDRVGLGHARARLDALQRGGRGPRGRRALPARRSAASVGLERRAPR
jgi:hypothetical protein